MTQETNDVVGATRELIESLKIPHRPISPYEHYSLGGLCREAADALQSQSARIAELEGALRLWLEYDDQDEADFARAGPMLLYARALDATRSSLTKDSTSG